MVQSDTQPRSCPICSKFDSGTDTNFKRVTYDHNHGLFVIWCRRCGTYELSEELYEDGELNKAPEEKLLYLSKLARSTYNEERRLRLTTETWKDSDLKGARLAAIAYYELVLLKLADRCKYPGQGTGSFPLHEMAALCGLPTTVVAGIAQQLSEAKLLQPGDINMGTFSTRLTIEGWERVDKLTLRRDPSRRAFVAMWFNPSLKPAYAAIEEMLKGEGYNPPFRVDDDAHDGVPEGERHSKIDDRILAEIRGSRFVIADFTGNRQAIYYEAGFAEGLGIPVLWTCRKDDLDKLNFDTRQHEHIIWTDEADLASQLQNKIRRRGWSWKRG